MNIIINFEKVRRENRQENNPYWPQIPENLHRLLIA